MKTIQEKYNALLENNFSKQQFVRDARLMHSDIISQFNGYDDIVRIFKNRGIINEVNLNTSTYPTYSLEELERGVDYELEKTGLDSTQTIEPEDYEKAKQKVVTNLEKDSNYYLNIIHKKTKKLPEKNEYVKVDQSKLFKGTIAPNGGKAKGNTDEKHAMQKVKVKVNENNRKYSKLTKNKVNENISTSKLGELKKTLSDYGNHIQINQYLGSLYKCYKKGNKGKYKGWTIQDYVEDFKNYIADESLEENKTIEQKSGKKTNSTPLSENIKYLVERKIKQTIFKVLNENTKKQPLTEAAASNLEQYINYENSKNEDLASRVRKGSQQLADYISKIEKQYLDIRDNIEKIYNNIGSFLAPTVAEAFRKDLKPVLDKYYKIDLPKSTKLSPEEIELIEKSRNK